jgi:hypothetical protein
MNLEKRNQAIKEWVSNPDRKYKDGVELYERYGSNRLLKQNFARKQSRFLFDKVIYELKKIAGMDTMILHTTRAVMMVPPSAAAISHEKMAEINKSLAAILSGQSNAPAEKIIPDLENTELELQRLHHRAAKLFTERAQLSNKLRECTTDADRKEIIERLKPLEKIYYKTQGEIKQIQKTGKVEPQDPEPQKEDKKYTVPADLVSQMKALNNARSRKSKEAKKLVKAGESSPKALKIRENIERETKFIKQLESIING